MKKRELIWLALLLVGALVAIVWRGRPVKPVDYRGKNAWQWAFQAQSPIPGFREEARAALQAMGSNAVPLLLEKFQAKESLSYRTRSWLGTNLPASVGSRFTRGLKPTLVNSDRSIAAYAFTAVGTNAAAAVPAFLTAMHDPELQILWDSASALVAIGEPAVPGLIPLLDDPNFRVRHAAAFALGQIGPPALAAVPALLRRLTDRVPEVRASTLYTLSRIGPRAGPAVLKVVQESRGEIRCAAAKALVAVHPRGQLSLPVLVEMARDRDAPARAAAIEALALLRMAHTNAMAVYVAGLDDADAGVRLAATKALGEVAWKSNAAAPALTALQEKDADEAVRIAAAQSLEKIAEANAQKSPPR